jgi:hypothetical protein
MNKPDSLRNHLLATVPDLKHNPDRLLVFIDEGAARCTAAKSLSWEYRYTLQLILTDYAGHPDAVMLPLLGWVKVNQSELLENLDNAREGIQFEAEILDGGKVDMAIKLTLTERVVVGKDAQGNTTLTHPAEPQPVLAYLDPEFKPGPNASSEWYIPNG